MKSHWHTRFLSLAMHVAQWSRDPDRRIGAVIVRPDKTIASIGFNGFPRGVEDSAARYGDKALKRELTVHAEMNAILHAREPLHGYSLYVWPILPCSRCAAAIVQSGIAHVFYVPLKQGSNWAQTGEIAATMLVEANVAMTMIDTPIALPELFIEPQDKDGLLAQENNA